jgi:hypothetical protein
MTVPSRLTEAKAALADCTDLMADLEQTIKGMTSLLYSFSDKTSEENGYG